MQILNGVNIVIASGSAQVQKYLQEAFVKRGAIIRLCGFLTQQFVQKLELEVDADVILIDMDDSYEEDEDALDLLLERIELPILFHDNNFDNINNPEQGHGFSIQVIDKLSHKLAELNEIKKTRPVADEPSAAEKSSIDSQDTPDFAAQLAEHELLEKRLLSAYKESLAENEKEPLVCEEPSAGKEPSIGKQEKELTIGDKENSDDLVLLSLPSDRKETKSDNDVPEQLVNVWVLGASIGGPEAVKRFLARIPAELPVAFVLAQHLGDGFISLLATQLDSVSRFKVKEAMDGDTLKHGEVIVVPVENQITLDTNGQIGFIEEKWQGHYKPSIDVVISEVTSSFETRSGVIIFSGMGSDGMLSSQKFAQQHHGIVWAQNPETCVISSMPDSVREAGLVSYSGSPEALALKIAMYYMGKHYYIH
ncbi:MAG: chemotaxis protein CheB [Gammaproteobacteria bacterium]|nr:chemotaxis protein CheB [Gammaproteobacteria bacterium]